MMRLGFVKLKIVNHGMSSSSLDCLIEQICSLQMEVGPSQKKQAGQSPSASVFAGFVASRLGTLNGTIPEANTTSVRFLQVFQ